jgi:hypothetical protein
MLSRFAAVKPHALAIAPDNDPISVMLDFAYPIGPGRRHVALNGLGGQDEARRVAAVEHVGADMTNFR